MAPAFLLLALGCAVGEARPEGPVATPDDVVVERPAERPAIPAAEAERLAVASLAEAGHAYEMGDATVALELAREIATAYPGTTALDSALWLGALSAFGLGRYEEAGQWAERYRSRQAAGSREAEAARSLAELAADRLTQATATPVIGALVPRSGPAVLVQYGDWVLEGIELAIREAERRQGRSIRLVVADDGGGSRTREGVAELERQGAVAIIGPLLPQHLREAAAARSDLQLMIVSPTVPEAPQDLRHVYSVAGGGDMHGARELARYAVAAGLGEAAVFHARGTEQQRRARAFAEEYQALGGRIRTTVSYESGTTTFAQHMRQILSAFSGNRPSSFALFIAAPDRDVPQIAPQISFYGLDAAGVQVLGDDAWASASVRRVVPHRDLEGVVAASPLPAGRGDAMADPEFVTLFENTYRRSLTNQLPALGYDAARVVLEALPSRLLTPGSMARSFELLTSIDGATGRLSVRGGALVRTPHLVVIRSGQLEPVAAGSNGVPAGATGS